jgi:hypothetical protein
MCRQRGNIRLIVLILHPCRLWSKQFGHACWNSRKTLMWMSGFSLVRPCKPVIK